MSRAITLLLFLAGAVPATEPTFSESWVNQRACEQTVGPGSSGPSVLRAQILLHRLHFSCGEIDGSYGPNMHKAIEAFQKANGLPSSAVVDTPTWAKLDRDSAPPLASYTITYQDVSGPFHPIPPDIAAKSKLSYLGYESPLEAIAEKFRS